MGGGYWGKGGGGEGEFGGGVGYGVRGRVWSKGMVGFMSAVALDCELRFICSSSAVKCIIGGLDDQ